MQVYMQNLILNFKAVILHATFLLGGQAEIPMHKLASVQRVLVQHN